MNRDDVTKEQCALITSVFRTDAGTQVGLRPSGDETEARRPPRPAIQMSRCPRGRL